MNNIEVYFSLGSNMGDRSYYINKAISLMQKEFNSNRFRIARIIETPAWGFKADTKFLNTVVCFYFPFAGQNPTLHCLYILGICKKIERMLGRIDEVEYDDNGNRIYHSRPIDIDVLFYGDNKIVSEKLIVPHPYIKERDFVMIPLKEIASDMLKLKFSNYFDN